VVGRPLDRCSIAIEARRQRAKDTPKGVLGFLIPVFINLWSILRFLMETLDWAGLVRVVLESNQN